jgi:hypothetical protein
MVCVCRFLYTSGFVEYLSPSPIQGSKLKACNKSSILLSMAIYSHFQTPNPAPQTPGTSEMSSILRIKDSYHAEGSSTSLLNVRLQPSQRQSLLIGNTPSPTLCHDIVFTHTRTELQSPVNKQERSQLNTKTYLANLIRSSISNWDVKLLCSYQHFWRMTSILHVYGCSVSLPYHTRALQLAKCQYGMLRVYIRTGQSKPLLTSLGEGIKLKHHENNWSLFRTNMQLVPTVLH